MASSLFFEESNLECWEKRKVKVTENCVEYTNFAFAATSRPGHMPRQLPARLSGIKPGLQYTQETGAKPRDFARTQAKKCLQSMRVCLQNFPACVTSQLVAQTTTESDHSFTVEFTTHKCTSTEENKMALACKKKGRIGFSFFVRCFVFASFLCSFLFFSFFADSYCRENH